MNHVLIAAVPFISRRIHTSQRETPAVLANHDGAVKRFRLAGETQIKLRALLCPLQARLVLRPSLDVQLSGHRAAAFAERRDSLSQIADFVTPGSMPCRVIRNACASSSGRRAGVLKSKPVIWCAWTRLWLDVHERADVGTQLQKINILVAALGKRRQMVTLRLERQHPRCDEDRLAPTLN
jgi:hypothetical protein